MKKKILAVILCIISIFCISGCGSVAYILQLESNGVVTEQLQISFKKADIESADKTFLGFNGVKKSIENKAGEYVSDLIENFVNSHNNSDELETFGKEVVTFDQIKNYVFRSVDFVQIDLFGNIYANPTIKWSNDTSGETYFGTITLTFAKLDAYYYFYDIYPSNIDDKDETTQDFVFYDKITDTSKTPFYGLKDNEIAQYFINYFDNHFSLSDMDYTFAYSTFDTKLYSNSDDVEIDDNGNKVHIWKFTSKDLDSESGGIVKTFTITIKAYVWYAVAILISLVVALVLFVVTKNKKSQNQKLNLMEH